MEIVKSNGERVRFDPERIRVTLHRINAKPEIIEHVLKKSMKQVFDGMTTSELFAVVRRELMRENHCLAHRFNLRNGLLKLGPAGFNFEKYIAAILQAYRYETEIPDQEIAGLCVMHEIDVIAQKDGKTVMIEAKFRNRFEDTVTLKDVMATWSRFQDLVDAAKDGKGRIFDEVWIMTNGRFSDRARQFGICKGIHLVGWNDSEQSLARMVDHAALYPITVLDDLHQWELEKLVKKDIILCREIADMQPSAVSRMLGVTTERANKIIRDAAEVIAL